MQTADAASEQAALLAGSQTKQKKGGEAESIEPDFHICPLRSLDPPGIV